MMADRAGSKDDLRKSCREIRKKLVCLHADARASHIGSSFSCVEILVALYFSILKVFPERPGHPSRDRFILSKGHAASALYAVLVFRGLIAPELLEGFHRDGSRLPGHPDRLLLPFIEASTGSLGHGLAMAVGMAYALKLAGSPARVFALMSDGEMEEGTVWESANAGSRLKLDNLTGIVDANKLQAFARTDSIMPIASFKGKWEAFGWSVREVDGHSVEGLVDLLKKVPFDEGKPSCVIAHTIKGKGISEMEGKMAYHYRSPRPEQVERFIRELDEKDTG